MQPINTCPNCGQKNIYQCTFGISGGGYAANYLPGLGGLFSSAELYPVICQDCGLVRFFIDEDARSKLEYAEEWQKK